MAVLCRATITNQILVNREGTILLLSASHSTRVSTPTTTISNPFYVCSWLRSTWRYECSKHSVDQSEDRILQINQSKNALKHL